MPKYKVKEFAEAFNIKESTVKSYVHRKQLQKDANHLIDTDNDKNKLFILEMQLGNGTAKVVKSGPVKKVKAETPNISKEEKLIIDIDLRKKIAETETAERTSELKRIDIEKKAGNLLPVEVVERILVINLQGIFNNFENELVNMASIYITDRSQLAEAVKELKQILSNSIGKAKEDSEAEIDNAINEYREIRSRGERK